MSLDEYQAACTAAGVFRRMGRQTVEVSGRDAGKFLHNLATNHVLELPVGKGCLAAFCNRKGRMEAVVSIKRFAECYRVEADDLAPRTLVAYLEKFIFAEEVKIQDLTNNLVHLGLCGPRSAAILTMCGFEIPPKPFDFILRDNSCITKWDVTGTHGFEISETGESLYDLIIRNGTLPISETTLNTLRIENGFPKWGIDMGPDDMPMEAGLESLAISYAKGCYPGQEVILRLRTYGHPPRLLRSLVIDGNIVPMREEKIFAEDGTTLGAITSACQSPSQKKTIALGYIKKTHVTPGTTATVSGQKAIIHEPRFQSLMRT